MANPRKFSEKIALHTQKQAEETAAFEKIMREVSDATNKPEDAIAPQYLGGRSGGTSPAPRSPVQRGRASSSVGPIRRPADRKHDTSPYGSSAYLSPPDSNWRRTNSDSALHQSCGEQQAPSQPLSPHHPLHSHAHPHAHPHQHPHQNHRRAGNIHLDVLATLGMNPTNRPRSSCEIPRIPNNNNVYESGGDGGGGGGGAGGLSCDLQVPGGSLPDLTALHFPAPYMRASPPYQPRYQSPTSPGGVSPGGVSPGGGSVSPATGGLSPGSGSPVGATVPLGLHHDHTLYDTQNHLSVPNTNNYLHHSKNMSPLDHTWMSSYQPHCSPPSQYSSTSNINIPSPTMVHSPGSPVESPQDYNNLHQTLLQPFEQITMLDQPTSNYNTNYINHSSPHSPQSTNSPHTYSQSHMSHVAHEARLSHPHAHSPSERPRDPVPAYTALRPLSPHPPHPPHPPTPNTPASIPDIILTDYSADLDAGLFGSEESQLRAGLDLDELTLLEEPSALLPDSAVEHEFRLDRLDGL